MQPPFSLPLTDIEHFFALDDHPGYPNQIVCRLVLQGRLDRERFESAFAEWSQRHPLLAARLERRGRRATWEVPKQLRIRLVWDEIETIADSSLGEFPPLPPLDLVDGPPARAWVRQAADRCEVIFQTHHATTDGIGGMTVIFELLQFYHASCASPGSAAQLPRRLDHDRLRTRGRYLHGFRAQLREIPKQSIGLYGAVKYWSRRSIPLLPDSVPSPSPTETIAQESRPQAGTTVYQPGVLNVQLDATLSEELKRLAAEADSTVNSWLCRDLLLAVHRWRATETSDRRREIYRIMIPMNMRTFADRRLSACNRVSLVYLDRHPRELRHPEGLLWGINFELRTIQRFNLGLTFLGMLRGMRSIPGLLPRQLQRRTCRSTCIFTNLGEPFGRLRVPRDEQGRLQIGNVTLESFDLLAPIRPLTAAAFSIYRYAKRMGVCLHYDRQQLSHTEATRLMDLYQRQIEESMRRRKQKREREAAKAATRLTSSTASTSTRPSQPVDDDVPQG